jgi:hypothetical protein
VLTGELQHRLRVEWAKAKLLSGGLDPAPAVMLACDLLVAGVDDEPVVALAAESARTLSAHDAERRLTAVVEALGVAEPSTPEGVALIAADTCQGILSGSLPVEDAAHRLYVVGHDGSTLDEFTPAVTELVGHLENDLLGTADELFTAKLNALARRILESPALRDGAMRRPGPA